MFLGGSCLWIVKDFIRLMKERDEEIHLFEGMRDHLIELA